MSFPTFKRGERLHAVRWTRGYTVAVFDQPCRVVRRLRGHYPDQDAYVVRHEGGEMMCYPAERLSREAVSYPGLTWLGVLDARGLPRPRGFENDPATVEAA